MVNSIKDRLFDWVVLLILSLLGMCVLFPIMYVVTVSVTPMSEVLKRAFILIPRKITLDAYYFIFQRSNLPQAFYVTTWITVVGTLINMVLTVMMAYPMSRRELPGRTFFQFYVIFTMLFSGGTIPTYILVRSLGLINSLWALIWPGAIWTFCVIVTKSFFQQLPVELFESARIDGIGEWRILFYIVIPLSLPVIVTISLYYAVGHWNEFFGGIMYITKSNLFPLQVVIRQILMQAADLQNNPDVVLPTQTMQMASIVVASAPIIIVYPWLQKHFAKGMLLGAIKG